MRLSSTSHSPSLLRSPPPPHLPPAAAAAAAALRRARTPQCKDCSSITFGARQGLVFRGQRANFSDGYIVQLDSLLAQASPHVSNSSSVPQLTRKGFRDRNIPKVTHAHISPRRRPHPPHAHASREYYYSCVFPRAKMIGLRNLANTCFVSSVLQCIYHTPTFIGALEKCRDKDHGKSLKNTDHPSFNCFSRAWKCKGMSAL